MASQYIDLPATAGSSGSTTDVNLTKVAGVAVATGHGTAAGALRVELPTDGTGVVNANIISGNPTTIATTVTDIAPATQNVTTQDLASSTATGANNQSIITGTPTANSAASFTISGQDAIIVQVSGTWAGTIQAEISQDSGTTWYIRGVHQAGTSYTAAAFTANFAGGLNIGGYTNFRIRATAAITGTAVVKITETQNINSVYIANSIKISDPTTPTQQMAIDSGGRISANVSQIAGTTADTNSGNKSAGTLRVTLATDQVALTNALLVTAAGDVASGATDSGNPIKIGGVGRTTNPTAVTDGQRVNSIFDKLGKQIIALSVRDLKIQQTTTITTSTAETTVLTAVASTFLDVYGVVIANSSATGANVTFKDATAGTTRFTIYVPAGDTRGFMLTESGAYNQAVVNNNWTATSSASITSLFVTVLANKNT